MKVFYLLRYEDVHGNTGNGLVAEGIIFDSGMCAMTWLTEYPTVTVFRKITDVKKIHGHEGRTEVIVQGQSKKFDFCVEEARRIKNRRKRERKDA